MKSLPTRILYYGILKPTSLLPFRVLYVLSDVFFLLLFYIFPYRKKIVLENLRGSFPEKNETEIQSICKEFYRHFCDVVVETIKLFSASSETIGKRVQLVNLELLEKYYVQNKSLILVTGHYANWEWGALTLPSHCRHKAIGIYQPLTNKFFNEKLIETRGSSGITLMPVKLVAKYFEDHMDQLCCYGFINDQSPSNPDRGHWAKFLNRDTCMLTGAERYAKQYDYPVLYGMIRKHSRGKYSCEYRLVTDQPRLEPDGEITEMCSAINESIIRENPSYWLWTHRRWKHKKK